MLLNIVELPVGSGITARDHVLHRFKKPVHTANVRQSPAKRHPGPDPRWRQKRVRMALEGLACVGDKMTHGDAPSTPAASQWTRRSVWTVQISRAAPGVPLQNQLRPFRSVPAMVHRCDHSTKSELRTKTVPYCPGQARDVQILRQHRSKTHSAVSTRQPATLQAAWALGWRHCSPG